MRYAEDSGSNVEAEEYAPSAATGPNINLRHYWYVLLERRWLVICSYVTVLALTGIYLYTAPRIYRATARIQIDPESESSVNIREMVFRTSANESDYLQTQYKNLLSRQLLAKVAKSERLADDPRYARNPDIVRGLADDISVSPVRGTRLVDVSVEHTSNKQAASIANKLIDEFIDWNSAQRQSRNADQLFFLRNQVSGLEGDVSKAELDLHEYRMRTKFVSLEKGDNLIAEALNQAQGRAADAKSKSQTSQALIDELDKHVKEGKSLETFPPISTDAQIKSLQGQLITQENELVGLLQKYKDKHPSVIQARSRIAETRRALDQAAQQLVNVLRSDAMLAKATQANLEEIVNDWKERQSEWNQAKMEYDVLARKAETKKALYNSVLSKLSELDVVQKEKVNNIRPTDPATTPAVPVKPNIPITVALGAIGGLVIALGLALFVNFMDDSIKSQDDVETYLRLPFLGYIPNIKSNSLTERYQHSHLSPQSNAAESFRTIRAAITLGSRGERARIFSVTSNLPSEGKSTVAANLATVVAQTGLKTLLVDTDLRRPAVHQGFGLRGVTGLAAYLAGKAGSLDEIVRTTDISNLDIVCCGSTPSQPSELLSSRRMTEFVQEASRRYERIILDCPPLSAVSDPLIVSTLADAVILVTKFNKVRREVARRSVQRMLDSGLQICGVVINDIDFDGRDAYYYSYYYYQNRYYKGYYHGRTEGTPEAKPETPPAQPEESKKLVS